MKACRIYKTNTRVIVYCVHDGLVSDPMVKLEMSETTKASLGQAVLEVLNASSRFKGLRDFKAITQAMVAFAGFKSWAALVNATVSSAFLETNERQITIIPTAREGRGFSADVKGVVTCIPIAESLGNALFEVLKIEPDKSSSQPTPR